MKTAKIAAKTQKVANKPTERTAVMPPGMIRLSEYVKQVMDTNNLTVTGVSLNSHKDPSKRIDPTTVWRIKNCKNHNVEDRSLVLLARGLGISPDTLRMVYLGQVDVDSSVRPIELPNELWLRLEQDALDSKRVIRTTAGSKLPDYSSQLAILLETHLPPLRKVS
jgi:hypothetical protein